MKEKSGIENLLLHVRDYAEERIKLMTLNINDKVSMALSDLTSAIIVALLGIFTLLFLSLALAWWLGGQLDNPFLGFLIVGAAYLLITILIYFNRVKWIRKPAINSVLKIVTDEED